MTHTPVNYGLIKITGPDAKKCLQGQFTLDMNLITSDDKKLCAFCNPQGRIISLFHVYLQQDAYYLLLPKRMVDITLNHLKKYAVFFKLTMTDASEEIDNTTLADWKRHNLAQGIPDIYPETSEKFLPHELNLHLLNAVSFDKGCYTGQEIIARMHYRGKLKNHLVQHKLTAPTTLQPGQEHPSGIVVDCDEHTALIIERSEQ